MFPIRRQHQDALIGIIPKPQAPIGLDDRLGALLNHRNIRDHWL